MDRTFDVAVVGSGSAGTQAATLARSSGRSVTVIEDRPFGGTCALRGCDPKKVLVHAARVVEETQRLAELGVMAAPAQLNWAKLMQFKRTFTDPVPRERVQTYEQAGIVPLRGHARFDDEQTLLVETDRVRAQHIVLASGAQESHVAQGDEAFLTSENFLELPELPESLLFVGGGYIAFEFAHVAARAGARVTILHRGAHPLELFDPEIVERVVEESRSIGIDVVLNAPVDRVERTGDGVVAHVKQGDRQLTYRAKAGVLAAGRKPNLDALEPDRGSVERTKKGVKVNEFLQSVSNPHVYAAGDVADAGGLPLTPVASYTGEIVAHNLLHGNTRTADFRGMPTMVYTIPPLGALGLTEATAREQGIAIDVHAGDMTKWYATRHVAGRIACYKVILEQRTGKLLGATILGPHAEEQINVLALAMRHGIDARGIIDTIFAYPTGSSDFVYLLE
jgi:glutathione reductase (NADPH)